MQDRSMQFSDLIFRLGDNYDIAEASITNSKEIDSETNKPLGVKVNIEFVLKQE